ncbi:hypothetical protein M23134_00522 [Microscilla marina ATCC 23134]|uniref:Uncharacterized protein n=1 Tax=Microscilla marina ATCC 23134 TaxID=313606 RepID=A1ZJA2_MICM2|nr:hypothetical protein M23134_00522 [Microscilla marina ATCC 23134]
MFCALWVGAHQKTCAQQVVRVASHVELYHVKAFVDAQGNLPKTIQIDTQRRYSPDRAYYIESKARAGKKLYRQRLVACLKNKNHKLLHTFQAVDHRFPVVWMKGYCMIEGHWATDPFLQTTPYKQGGRIRVYNKNDYVYLGTKVAQVIYAKNPYRNKDAPSRSVVFFSKTNKKTATVSANIVALAGDYTIRKESDTSYQVFYKNYLLKRLTYLNKWAFSGKQLIQNRWGTFIVNNAAGEIHLLHKKGVSEIFNLSSFPKFLPDSALSKVYFKHFQNSIGYNEFKTMFGKFSSTLTSVEFHGKYLVVLVNRSTDPMFAKYQTKELLVLNRETKQLEEIPKNWHKLLTIR